jgi:hypothetical protein
MEMKAGRVILLFTGFRWGCAFIQVKKARDQHSMIGIAQLSEGKGSHIWQYKSHHLIRNKRNDRACG